jgi:hypothetical protein
VHFCRIVLDGPHLTLDHYLKSQSLDVTQSLNFISTLHVAQSLDVTQSFNVISTLHVTQSLDVT